MAGHEQYLVDATTETLTDLVADAENASNIIDQFIEDFQPNKVIWSKEAA
ncbi:hypothetical protein [Schleiferilactobacillus perolens]|nr:hypothetical protein [Schleiferilactobacillus perolens]